MRKNLIANIFVLATTIACAKATAYSNPHNWLYDTGWKLNIQAEIKDGSKVGADYHDSSSPVYVCQYMNLPGKHVNGMCYVALRGKEYGSPVFNSLLTKFDGLAWASRLHGPYKKGALPDQIRSNAVIGGSEGFDVYICKGMHGPHSVVGKFVRGHGCYYGHRGREYLLRVSEDNFSVLIDNYSGQR
ncbi:DUF3421 domain-containing protein [Pseudoalteromonas sp. JBTF-M23]|uniref:DUF3421 domain-containing protein n=1 Tax=Pseudoalteromonas caenipelagi TaxID=2726988 RepID=A0A849VAR6_9GAMM|nr:DM9 repeat-containing protein [Pseudoalteromonas caenipelagi]NOU49713.1 DUF3421 domain-containing protein [Pseudoalteromonas caenipelagi]